MHFRSIFARRGAPALFAISVTPALVLGACADDPTTTAVDGGASGEEGGAGKDAGKDGAIVEVEKDSGAETDTGTPDGDASPKDAAATIDAACVGPIVTKAGETCTGFGTQASSCDPACGQPYGYVCFEGAPPNFAGCREQRSSAFGNTYCCPKNECVERPDRAADCVGVVGKPKHFQCPPLDNDAGHVTPGAGCVERNSGPTIVEKYYCCP